MLNKGNDFLLKGIEREIKKDLVKNPRNTNPQSDPNQDERFYRDMSGKKIPQNKNQQRELDTPRNELWHVLQNTGPAVSCYRECNSIMPINQNGTNYFVNDGSAPWSKRKRPRNNSVTEVGIFQKKIVDPDVVDTFEKSGFMTAAKQEKKLKIRSLSGESKKVGTKILASRLVSKSINISYYHK